MPKLNPMGQNGGFMSDQPNYDKISPTAKMVAYWRQFADLPFSKDIAREFKVEETIRQVFGPGIIDLPRKDFFVPMVEIRYNCIQNFILKENFKQVLEFASGVSLRGLAMTKDPEMVYVETDLPGLTTEKNHLIKSIMTANKIAQRNKLFFHSTNILNYSEITPALAHFDTKKPLLIANEGLFQYLNKDEKKIAGKNIHKILSTFNGMWITPDFDVWKGFNHAFLETQENKKVMDVVNQKTERSFEKNSFKDEEEVRAFFEEIGFKVSHFPQWSPSDAVSSLKTKDIPENTLKMLESLRLWVLTVQN